MTAGVEQASSAAGRSNAVRATEFLRTHSPMTEALTFDMSGGWRQAQPAGNRPLDGRVRRHGMHEAQFAPLATVEVDWRPDVAVRKLAGERA